MTKCNLTPNQTVVRRLWQIVRSRTKLIVLGLILVGLERCADYVPLLSLKYLIDTIAAHKKISHWILFMVVVIAGVLVQSIVYWWKEQLLPKEARKAIHTIQAELFSHLLMLPVQYFDSNSTGTLTARVMRDAEGISSLLGLGLVNFAEATATCIIIFALITYINVQMAAILAIYSAAVLLLAYVKLLASRKFFSQRQHEEGQLSGMVTEALVGIKTLKCYNREKQTVNSIGEKQRRIVKLYERWFAYNGRFESGSRLLDGVIWIILLVMGARLVLGNRMTIGEFVVIDWLLTLVFYPLRQMVSAVAQSAEAVAGLERIESVLAVSAEWPESTLKPPKEPMRGHIQFESVSFAYKRGETVLGNVSFEIQPGTVTAIVGSSGAGKSTIVSLLTGFYIPDSGHIKIDGVDLQEREIWSYRRQIGLVLQEPFILNASIRDNVTLWRENISSLETIEACRVARVDEFVLRLPDGYDTIVGERGLLLSGGQRQRLAIARAIVGKPKLLVLDEGTSNLDPESEALIQGSLAELAGQFTTLIIAHRIGTILSADEILVLEDGVILEKGSYEELMVRQGRFHEIFKHSIVAGEIPTASQ